MVYTPLHGVAAGLALRAFERAGFPPPHVVAAQAEPDPAFPTVAFPNPEEPGTLDLALAQARETARTWYSRTTRMATGSPSRCPTPPLPAAGGSCLGTRSAR